MVGPMTDRIFLSFHSNAAGGGISNTRGTLGLYNGNNDPTTATPNQQAWAQLMGSEVQGELVALEVPRRGLAGLFGKYRDDPTLRDICESAYRERHADTGE